MCPTGSVQAQSPPSSTPGHGHVAIQQAQLDIFHLEESVSLYLSRALTQHVLQGIKRLPARAARQPQLPITPTILCSHKQQWETVVASNQNYIMLWAADCVDFFGFMQAEEFLVTSQSHFDPEYPWIYPGNLGIP